MTPEQLLKRLEREGGKLEAASLRAILRAFKDADTRALVAMLTAEMLKANPAARLHAKGYLEQIAAATFPTLPVELLSLTQSGAVLGAQAGAGMLGVQAAPFVPAVVGEVASELGGLLKASWGDAQKDHASRVGKVITAALKTGGRYPVASQLQRQLQISRKQAQGLGADMLQTVISVAQDRVIGTAEDELGVRVMATWRAASDPRVRASHRALNGQTVERGKTFKAGLVLRFPRDPQCKDVGEIRRCRCQILYEVQDD